MACNLAGGTHHAHYGEGSGFTIFNDLVVTAKALVAVQRAPADRVRRVLIVDLDVHQGDGTAALVRGDDSIFSFSMHCESNFPLRKQPSDLDIGLADGVGDTEYLETLAGALPSLLDTWQPDLVLYDAGVDVHADDRLGRLALTTRGMRLRDQYVLRQGRAENKLSLWIIGLWILVLEFPSLG